MQMSRLPVILSHTLQRLRRLLSVSEESVTDPSLHFVPFRMTGDHDARQVPYFRVL